MLPSILPPAGATPRGKLRNVAIQHIATQLVPRGCISTSAGQDCRQRPCRRSADDGHRTALADCDPSRFASTQPEGQDTRRDTNIRMAIDISHDMQTRDGFKGFSSLSQPRLQPSHVECSQLQRPTGVWWMTRSMGRATPLHTTQQKTSTVIEALEWMQWMWVGVCITFTIRR